MVVGVLSGCGGDSDSPTGPQGQTLEVNTEEWDNGNIKVEFQYYRDGGSVVKHGFYKVAARGSEHRKIGEVRVDEQHQRHQHQAGGGCRSYGQL